jgi:hypothetical protein
MRIFISYARNDAISVRQLHRDIGTAGHNAWIDERLEGGQDWWQQVLEHISSCALFVFAVSPDSIQSRACGAELEHAIALRRPILPVCVRDVDLQSAPDPLPALQVVDYRERTPELAIELTAAINRTPEFVPLPDLLPSPPPPPNRSFGPLRALLAKPNLSHDEQQAVLQDLRERIASVDERETATTLLRELKVRPDVVQSVAQAADSVLMRAAHLAGYGPRRKDSPEAADLLRSVVTQIQRRYCTPIVGWGLTDSLVGPRQLIARSWADTFEFPMAVHQRDDLPQVANFVAAMTDVATLRESLGDFYRRLLRERYPSRRVDPGDGSLRQLISEAWGQHRKTLYVDPYEVLADLPCRIYVTAQPHTLLAEALQANGKAPEVELCRWRPDVHNWPASVYDREPSYTPTPERPLVFHVFGNLDFVDSLVITEDDYIDFLARVAKTQNLVPAPVREALADSALLVLGFRLEEWDIRVLLRSLVQPGAKRLRKYPHVAAQVDIGSEVLSPPRARRYLERYFGKVRQPSIDIYWGTVEEFAAGLAAALRTAK